MTAPVVHIVGARPNFMKLAPVVAALRSRAVEQRLVHTGQHYDATMSDVFFDDLRLPEPDLNLGVGSGTHAGQTAALMTALEAAFQELRPAIVVVYGDVNSTLAAALVASKTGLPLAHVEAGLRSFDMTMPEEVNRRLVDVLADLLFVTSPEAVGHLGKEGCDIERVHFVGNPMIDTLTSARPHLDAPSMASRVGVGDGPYAVATLHRPANVDSAASASELVAMFGKICARLPCVLPLHPRGRSTLEAAGLGSVERLHVVEPLGYIDFLSLVSGADVVLTDSGGIQEETTMLDVPCLTLRSTTERPITVTHGTNRLTTPTEAPALVEAILVGELEMPMRRPPLWDGASGQRIAQVLVEWLSRRSARVAGASRC